MSKANLNSAAARAEWLKAWLAQIEQGNGAIMSGMEAGAIIYPCMLLPSAQRKQFLSDMGVTTLKADYIVSQAEAGKSWDEIWKVACEEGLVAPETCVMLCNLLANGEHEWDRVVALAVSAEINNGETLSAEAWADIKKAFEIGGYDAVARYL